MNNLKKIDLNLSQNQNGCNSSQGQKKNTYFQDLQLRFRQTEEDKNTLTNRITNLLNSKLEEAQELTDQNTQLKCTMKMLNFSRTKIEQCNEALAKLCKHQNLMVDILNKTEEFRVSVERKVKNVETKCKTTINILCTKLQTRIEKENQIVKENFDFKLKLNQSIEEISTLKETINNHNLELERIDAEFNETSFQINSDKEKVEMENETLTEKYNNLEKQNQAFKEDINKAKQTISNLEEIIKENAIDLKNKLETIEKLKNENNVLSKDVKSYSEKIIIINESLTGIQQELVKKTESIVNLENEKSNLQKEIQILNNKIVDLTQSKLLEKEIAKKKANDFNLREQLLKEEQNRLIIRFNSRQHQYIKKQHFPSKPEPQVLINEWDTNTSQSDITEQSEKKINLFSKPSKYVMLPSKRSNGFRWSASKCPKITKYSSQNNVQNTQGGIPEEIVTSSCK